MRTFVILGGVVVAAAVWAFVHGSRFGRAEVEKAQPRALRAVGEKGPGATSAMERLVVGELARADFSSQKLESLDQRMRALEAARGTDNATETATATDSDRAAGKAKLMPEDVLGHWMFDRLRRGAGNSAWTRNAESQVEERLSVLPGVEVEAVECGERFGHVKFFRRDGAQLDVVPLLGLPPFDNESFTAPNDDGSVSIYFTAPGVKIEELRAEAMATAG